MLYLIVSLSGNEVRWRVTSSKNEPLLMGERLMEVSSISIEGDTMEVQDTSGNTLTITRCYYYCCT